MTNMGSPFETPLVELTSQLQECKRYAEGKVAKGVIVNGAMGAERCVIKANAKALSASMYTLLDTVTMLTEKGSITVGYEVYDSEVYIFVKSSGLGLTPEMCEKMFDESTYANMYDAKKAIEGQGGEIGVESRGLGRGCTFWITMPADFDDIQSEPEEKAQDTPVRKFAKTILVAEDNENNYYLLYALLRDRYNILHAHDGAEAVDMFQAEHPDLVLMDINMPVLDGYEATARIRTIDQDIPILAVTAYAFTADVHRIRESGFSGYISKPIAIKRLDRELERLLPQ